jgi:hypothetical protein
MFTCVSEEPATSILSCTFLRNVDKHLPDYTRHFTEDSSLQLLRVTHMGIPNLTIYVITNFRAASACVPQVINIYYPLYIKLMDGY